MIQRAFNPFLLKFMFILAQCHRPVESHQSLPAVHIEASEEDCKRKSTDLDQLNRSVSDPDPSTSTLLNVHIKPEDFPAHIDLNQRKFGTVTGYSAKENKIFADHLNVGISISSSESEFVERSSRSTQTSHHSHKSPHGKRSGHGIKKKNTEEDAQRNISAGHEDEIKVGDRIISTRAEIKKINEETEIASTEAEKKEVPKSADNSASPFKEKLERKRKESESYPPVSRQPQSADLVTPSKILQDKASLLEDKIGVFNNSLSMSMDRTMLSKNDKENVQLSGESAESSSVTGDLLTRSRETASDFYLNPFTISSWDWKTNAQFESIKQNRKERHAELLSKLSKSPSAFTYGEESNGSCIESSPSTRFQTKLGHHRKHSGSSRSESVHSSHGRARGLKRSGVRNRISHENSVKKTPQENVHALTAARLSQTVGVRGRALFWRLISLVCAHTALWLPALLLVQVSEERSSHFMNPSTLTLLLLAWLRPLVGSALLLWFTLNEPWTLC